MHHYASHAADLSDPMHVAVKVTAMEGALALLGQQVSQGLSTVQSQLSALQGETRENTRQLALVAQAQAEFQAYSSGLDRLAVAIEKSTAENLKWREKHELENRSVADSVTSARGVTRFIAWIGAFIVGLVVFSVQLQFDGLAKDRLRIEHLHRDDIQRLEKKMDQLEAVVEDLRKMKGLQ